MQTLVRKRWQIKPDPAPATVAALAQSLGVLPLTARVLMNRGLTDSETAGLYLAPTGSRFLDFHQLPGVLEAGRLIAEAIRSKTGIAVFGDYDVDGITAAAVMTEFIQDRGGRVRILLPDRLHDGYGLNTKAFETLADQGVRLLVTVDCGITALAEVARARELGLSVVITDHHEPGNSLPAAQAVVNPKIAGPEAFRHLAGVGVALQVVRAAAEALGEENHEPLRKYLDLVALGTVADVVPLLGENRMLTRAGLAVINRGGRPGLTALIRAAGLEMGKLTSQDLAFKLAPRLNAAGRIGDPQLSYRLLMTPAPKEAEDLAGQLNELNARRQALEKNVIAQALEQLPDAPNLPWALVAAAPDWPLGVLGLAASKLCERHHRPCFVLSRQEEGWRGSGRSISGFPLHTILDSLAPLLSKWGGHELAAGVSLPLENLEAFKLALAAEAEKRLTGENLIPELTVDAQVRLEELTPRLCRELSRLEPFGFQNFRPILAAEKVRLAAPARVVGERHLKLKVKDGQGRPLDVIGFGWGECAADLSPDKPLDIAGHLVENIWNQTTTLQMELKDLRWD
ncbi:MAG: single-stranded-DNA-specific exonuclease RecJ [Candidatus Firestonebacteria bacterium]|nr:single-stranded-DNA-specific exonuclease RecJ [Candidatus Firestonebacteria bacterium]